MAFTKIEHYEKEYLDAHHNSALNVTEGVEDKPVVNPNFVRRKRRQMSTEEYVDGILAGNITILAQAITLIESNNPSHYAQAQEIIERCLPHAGPGQALGVFLLAALQVVHAVHAGGAAHPGSGPLRLHLQRVQAPRGDTLALHRV